jgi:hypothetical protein
MAEVTLCPEAEDVKARAVSQMVAEAGPSVRRTNPRLSDLLDEARARGLDPIEFLLNEMDRLIKLGDEVSRDKARTIAKEVAQYCYPRLSTQNVTAIVEEKRHVIRVPKSRRRWTSGSRLTGR